MSDIKLYGAVKIDTAYKNAKVSAKVLLNLLIKRIEKQHGVITPFRDLWQNLIDELIEWEKQISSKCYHCPLLSNCDNPGRLYIIKCDKYKEKDDE